MIWSMLRDEFATSEADVRSPSAARGTVGEPARIGTATPDARDAGRVIRARLEDAPRARYPVWMPVLRSRGR